MSLTKEQAAVLALTRATAGPWHHTARVVEARGSALRLLDGDLAGLDADDRAHAAGVLSRVRPGDLDWGEELIASAGERGVALVTVLDDDYPGNLAFAYNLQPFLWVRGRLRAADCRSVAIVGDGDGRAEAEALAGAGLTVVCDAATAARESWGRVVAVLPGGMDGQVGSGLNGQVGDGMAGQVEGGMSGQGPGVTVSPFWPGTAVSARTAALSHIVTGGLAAAVYVTGGRDAAARAAMALSQGKHVFVPRPEQPWVPGLAYRGGVTVVAGIDDLIREAVNLVDVTRLSTVF